MNSIGKRTGIYHVRFETPRGKYYKAVLDEFGGVRLSRRQFQRAGAADQYAQRVVARLKRLRSLAMGELT